VLGVGSGAGYPANLTVSAVATTLAGLTKDNGLASKGLLRHSNLATTTWHYIHDVPENTLSAMELLEKLCNDCATPSIARPN